MPPPRPYTSGPNPNFGYPVADIASANFGKILLAGSPRLMQFALKLVF